MCCDQMIHRRLSLFMPFPSHFIIKSRITPAGAERQKSARLSRSQLLNPEDVFVAKYAHDHNRNGICRENKTVVVTTGIAFFVDICNCGLGSFSFDLTAISLTHLGL